MSTESDADYDQNYNRTDRRQSKYRSRNDDDDDDDDDDDNNSDHNYNSGRNRSHRRRRGRRNYHYEKGRRPTFWYSHMAARIMGICLLFSFFMYEVSILRTPLSTDLFNPVTSHVEVKPGGPTSVRLSDTKSDYGGISSRRKTAASSAAAKRYSSTASSTSSSSSNPMSSSMKSEDPTKPYLKKPRAEQMSPLDIPADADSETPQTGSDRHSNSENFESGKDRSEKSNDGSDDRRENPGQFRPLRRRRHVHRPHSDFSQSASDSASESKMRPVSDTDNGPRSMSNQRPMSALKINVDGTDENERGSSSSKSSKSDQNSDGERKKEDVPKPGNQPGDGEGESEERDKAKESMQNGSSGANGGSEPGAGENFWQWFQESKGNANQNVSATIQCPDDSKRLCTMFYKYLRKYKIRSVFDASCQKNLEWMPDILKAAGGELWGFKYYCSITEDNEMASAKEKLSPISFVEFSSDAWWKTGFPQKIELLFAWDTLAHIAFGRVWNFFVKAKSSRVKYILIDNYPSITNDPSPDRQFINVRRHPFKFPSAKEVVQNVTEPGETAKRQLLFYETEELPGNLQ